MKKKQKQVVTIPTKPKPKPKADKPKSTKKVTTKTKEPKEQPQQINLSDFTLATSVDVNRIQIVCSYQGQLIHIYILPASEYGRYQRYNFQKRYNYFFNRTIFAKFGNNGVIVQAVITSIIELIDKIFARSQRRL
jgi:hypothetical protein